MLERPGGGTLTEETFGVDRETHLDVAAGESLLHEAHGPLDALGPDPYTEAGGSAAYLDRNLHHLALPSKSHQQLLRELSRRGAKRGSTGESVVESRRDEFSGQPIG